MDSRSPLDTVADAAREAAYNVGPRVYRLTGINNQSVRFLVLGCQGNGGESQKHTAAKMNSVAASLAAQGKRVDFVLSLGDNIYDHGVSSPLDSGFDSCFYSIYRNDQLTSLNLLTWFLSEGNHDKNFEKFWMLAHGGTQGDAIGINQAARTYIGDDAKKSDAESISKQQRFFEQSSLPVDDLKKWKWNMPYFFYSIIANNTQIFVLDSNSYLKEYLALLSGRVSNGVDIDTGLPNQAIWLQREFAEAKKYGRQIFFAQHHPLFVSGKRAFPGSYDTKHYLSEQEVVQLNELLREQNPNHIETKSYNELLAAVYRQQGFDPEMVFAAHEHCINYLNDAELTNGHGTLRQFTSGGGGGDLQKRSSYRGHPYVSMHQMHNGFGVVTCKTAKPHTFKLDVHTNEGLHLRFNETSHQAEMNRNSNSFVEQLQNIVLSACNSYFNILKEAEISKIDHKKKKREEKVTQPNQSSGYTASVVGMFKSAKSVYKSTRRMAAQAYEHFYPENEELIEQNIIQDLQAYFLQLDLPNRKAVLQHLFGMTQRLPFRVSKNLESFYNILNETVMKELHYNLTTLFNANGFREPAATTNDASLGTQRVNRI